MDGLGDPDLLVSELLVGFSSARNSWAALQLSLVPNFRRADFRCSLTVLTDRPVVRATSFARMGVSRSRRHSFSLGVRSEERRVGKACVSTFRSRWSAYH